MRHYVLAATAAILMLGLGACAETSTDSESSSSDSTAPFRASDAQVRALIERELGDTVEDSSLPRVRSVNCNRITCVIDYNADTPFWKAEKTLLEEPRPIWKALFSDRRLKEAKIITWGETTSVGGKSGRSRLMRVTCDRAAHRQIDWDAIDSHGVATLCTYVPLVNFE